jgi:hypothetical protein
MNAKAKRQRLLDMVDWRHGDLLIYMGADKVPHLDMKAMFVSWVDSNKTIFSSENVSMYEDTGLAVPERDAPYWTLAARAGQWELGEGR